MFDFKESPNNFFVSQRPGRFQYVKSFSLGVQWTGREAGYSSPYSSKITNS